VLTLIVGIACSDGIVLASDSAATFAMEGMPTIGQQQVTKIQTLSEVVLYASTGAVGISQLIANSLKTRWDKKEFSGIGTPEEMMHKIGVGICELVRPYLESANLTRSLNKDPSPSLCKCIVGIPVKKKPCLLTFDYNGAPEAVSAELPFVSMGCAQGIADPFLALLRRLLWQPGSTSPPTIAEGRLVAAWTIEHARLTNPGGVGGPIQLSTLSADGVAKSGNEDIQEHLARIHSAEKALVEQLRPTTEGPQAPAPPSLLAECGPVKGYPSPLSVCLALLVPMKPCVIRAQERGD